MENDDTQQKEMKEYREAFDLFDLNKDGKITADELRSVMKKLGTSITEREALDMIRDVDVDESETIEFDEFVAMMKKDCTENDEDMLAAFKLFDKDNNDLIDEEEMMAVLENLKEKCTAEYVKEMIKEADLDGDGRISFHEFKKIMSSHEK